MKRSIVEKIKKLKFIIIGMLIFIIAIGIFIYRRTASTSTVSYQTEKAVKGTIVSTVAVSGQIVASGSLPVTTQASGTVKTVFVKNGDKVVSGQKILELTLDQSAIAKQTQAYASYLSAKNSVDSAQTSYYTLQNDLFNKWKAFMDLSQNSTYQNPDGSPNTQNRELVAFRISQNDWFAAEAKYKTQQTVLSQSQANLSSAWNSYQNLNSVITAPTDGTVSDLIYTPGMLINVATGTNPAPQKVASIRSETVPVFLGNLSEVDVPKIVSGNKATLTIDALPDKTFTGIVVGVDTSGSVTSGVTNYPMTIRFDTEADGILTNMSASANVITATKDTVIMIPTSAIQTVNDQPAVRVLVNRKMTFKYVTTGLVSDSQTEIVSGIGEGEEVITSVVSNGTTPSAAGSSPFSPNFRFGGAGGTVRTGTMGGGVH